MIDFSFIKNFYLKDEIKNQIIEYSKNRWIALEGYGGKERLFYRYYRNKEPIKLNNEDDLKKILLNFKFRTIYATINIYNEVREDKLKDLNNIVKVTPVFDIDGSLLDFEYIKQAAEVIISELDKYNLRKSVYLVWSGRGIHIHINENSITLKDYHPLDIAFSIVDYIISKVKDKIAEISSKAKNVDRELKVENKIDIQRVFTVPFSFHRFLDYVSVPFKPDDLYNFDLSWVDPNNYKYNKKWNEYEEGEANELAEIALKNTKRYTRDYLPRIIYEESKEEVGKNVSSLLRKNVQKVGNIGRFQVMGLLQAARYYLLKGDINKAKSFGLNRAIFYAWAKYYRPVYGFSKKTIQRKIIGSEEERKNIEEKEKFEIVGNEKAPISDSGYFIIGDKEQRPEDFDKEIKEKIESVIDFNTAWNIALEYLKKFPKEVLEDQQEFYKKVYEPIRDNFLELVEKYKKENK